MSKWELRWASVDVYDWWAGHPRLYRAMTSAVLLGAKERLLGQAADALAVGAGDRVLDLGCGDGPNFALLEAAVGRSGRIVAVDASAAMLAAARWRALRDGWSNIELIEADAASAPLAPASLDAALCTLALSAIDDHGDAIAAVRAALKPGAPFVVVDAKPLEGPWRMLNPLLNPLFGRVTNWDYGVDLPAALRDAFTAVDIEWLHARSCYCAVARDR